MEENQNVHGGDASSGKVVGKTPAIWSRMSPLAISFLVTGVGLLVGLALHFLAVYLRDYGPQWGGFSLRGNGALVVLPVAAVVLLVGEVFCGFRRAWLGMILYPIALFLGMFVIAGSF